jgi:hypothetical protein
MKMRYTTLARLVLGAGLLPGLGPGAHAALFRRSSDSSQRAPAIALRKRLHVNPLITEPGNMDIEWGGAFSVGGSFTFPAVIHYTPEGHHFWWGRTEWSLGFDSISSAEDSGSRATHFSDRMTVVAISVVHDGEKLDIAIAPQVSYLLRGDDGIRGGATAIARYDAGKSSAGVTFTWTGASHSSPTNPAGSLDAGAGYGYHLASTGPFSHLTPHANVLWERSTGVDREISLFEGLEYQINPKVAIDFSGQHLNVWGGPRDTQIVVGLTIGLGRLHF